MTKLTANQIGAIPLGSGFHTALRKGLDSKLSAIAWNAVHLMDEAWARFAAHLGERVREEGGFDARILRDAALSWEGYFERDAAPAETTGASIFRSAIAEFPIRHWVELAQFIRECSSDLAASYQEDEFSFGLEMRPRSVKTVILNANGDEIAELRENRVEHRVAFPPLSYSVRTFGQDGSSRPYENFEAARAGAFEAIEDVLVARRRADIETGSHERHAASSIQGALDLGDARDAALARAVGDDAQILLRKSIRFGKLVTCEYTLMTTQGDGGELTRWKVVPKDGGYEAEPLTASVTERVIAKLVDEGAATYTTGTDDDLTVGRVRLELRDGYMHAEAKIASADGGACLVESWTSAPIPAAVIARKQAEEPASAPAP